MKEKFQTGDRVRVYDVDRYQHKPMSSLGTVVERCEELHEELVCVEVDCWDPPGHNTFHEGQCRRVRKASNA